MVGEDAPIKNSMHSLLIVIHLEMKLAYTDTDIDDDHTVY